jgi:uncharacterized damage-inducible protein DinB
MSNKSNAELLLYMLDDVRRVTLKGIKGLTKEQLFQPPIPGEYPAGAYLMHFGEADLAWLEIASGEKQPEELKKRLYSNCWYDPSESPAPPAAAPEVEDYIGAITEARERIKKYFAKLKDEELEEEVSTSKRKVSRKWILYHLIEHEAHHRGQMFMLIRMAGFKAKGENK